MIIIWRILKHAIKITEIKNNMIINLARKFGDIKCDLIRWLDSDDSENETTNY